MRTSDISLEDALTIIQGVFSEQRKQNLKPMAVVVVGYGGSVRASQCQDGTSLLRHKVAYGKAYGSVATGLGSRSLYERAQKQPYFMQAINNLCDGALVPVPGGVLIRNTDGDLVGAVGVTGDSSDNDERCAVLAIEEAGFVADTGG